MTTTTELPKIHSSAEHSFAYYGDREGWSIALTVHRDSEALDRSNWEVITADILAIPTDGDPADGLPDAAIESASHFLVGWVDYLLVRPGSSAERRALEWREKLDNYPVADEDHYYELEWNEEWCVRCDRATREEHPTTRCGKFRSAEDDKWPQENWAKAEVFGA
jgi:hypothetical protein